MTTIPQTELDALTRLASFICQTPVSLISLVGENGQLFITRLGPDANETSLEVTFCQDVNFNEDIFVIEDTLRHGNYRNNPLVTGAPHIRFFAGVKLKDADNAGIGALYAIDKTPKTLSEDQQIALITLGNEIAARFQLNKRNNEIEAELKELKNEHLHYTDQDLIDYKYALDKTSMISIFGPDGNITYVNDKFCEISGFTTDEIIGKDHRIFNPDLHSKEFIKNLWHQISHGNIFQSEIKNKAKDGNYFWVAATIIPFLDENGRPNKYLSISYDVTQKKLQEQQLIEVKVLAENLTRSKDIFLTNMSHEIRTPLNAITGLGKLLSKSTLDPQQRNYLNGIESASENLLSVINDILDFSKIEAGKITLENISFNFESVCEQAINILSHKAEEKGLFLACKIDPEIGPVLIGDPFRINQVFMNMLGNAIKFTNRGFVSLKATLLSQADNLQKVQINIEDTGVGINEDYLSHIFDKFTQEDETIVRKFGGTGLGMSITKELMELMGGTISISSKKDVGTNVTLIFTFRIGTSRVLEKKRTIKNDTSNIVNKKILLVEDNSLNRLLAKTILTDYGALVTEAENGQIAVDFMRAEHFDVILMDIQMPVMDGIKATNIIRKEINATIPIIALTANAIKGKLDQFAEAGMNDYIFKPYDELKLVNPIAKWLKPNTGAVPHTHPVAELQPPPANIIEIHKVAIQKPSAPASVPEFTGPLYDMSKLQAMSSNNDDFIMKMLNLFVTEIPPSVRKIMEAYDADDMPSIKYYAHMLKPSIFNLGIKDITAEIVKIESAGEKGEKTPELGTMIRKLDKVVSLVVEQMKVEYNL